MRGTGKTRGRRGFPVALVASLVGAAFVPLAVAEPASAEPVTTTFACIGRSQAFVVPAGVTSLDVDMAGASGGNASQNGYTGGSAGTGAKGARVRATIPVAPYEVLRIKVGCAGGDATGAVGGTAGWNGGGAGGGQSNASGGGGGASDVSQGGSAPTDRVVVGGGGGGGGASGDLGQGGIGGAGGTTTGASGSSGTTNQGVPGGGGGGGTPLAGGAGGTAYDAAHQGTAGSLGRGGPSTNAFQHPGGGGGGGYYGGGSGGHSDEVSGQGGGAGGGGGGSSFAGASATNVIHTQGYQTGNGYVTLTWTPDPSAIEPPPLAVVYPSDDASCSAAGNVIRGFIADTFLQVRTGPDAGGGTAVCVAADDGSAHLGGKLVVDGAPDALTTDANAGACALDANNERVQSGMLLGQPYALDVTPLPDGEPDAAWVCVQAAGTGVRLVLDHEPGTGTRFEPDSLIPHPPYLEEAWPAPGQPSADCKEGPGAGTRVRVANLRLGAADRVAAYAWQESAGRSHVCVRAQSGSTFAGRKITIDVAGAPSVTTGNDLGPCTFAVFTRDQFPRFGVYTSDPEGPTPPVSACVQVLDTVARVTVDAPEPGPVTVSEDTA